MVIGTIENLHLGNGVGLAIDLNECKDFHTPVGSKVHPPQQTVFKGHLPGQLIVEIEEKIHDPENLVLLSVCEFPLERNKERIEQQPLGPTVKLVISESGIERLGKLVVQHHDRIEKPVNHFTVKRSNIGVHNANALSPQGQSDTKREEHIPALARFVESETRLREFFIN